MFKHPSVLNTFLSLVASDVIDHFQSKLSDILFILPNRRSAQTFESALISQLERPVWAPQIIAVSDWVLQSAPFQPAGDTERLIFLYRALQQHWDKSVDFPSFLTWGETLLRDFEEVDKYLVDARLLFSQLSDEKEIARRFSMLDDPEFRRVLRFWSGFEQDPSVLQQDWLDLWNVLSQVYEDYHEMLRTAGKADVGAAYRDMVSRFSELAEAGEELPACCFIGFNAPVRAEERLFDWVQKHGTARFYWDAPSFLADLPDRWPAPESFSRLLAAEPGRFTSLEESGGFQPVQAYAFDSAAAQARFFSRMTDGSHQTAVVLADEALLDDFLWGLHPESGDVNVSIGRAVAQTRVGGQFLAALRQPEDGTVPPDRQMARWAEELSAFVADADTNDLFSGQAAERIRLMLDEAADLAASHPDLITTFILKQLLARQLGRERIPFASDFDAPVQITGILETRLMDYERVYILSFNEGVWPAGSSHSSFIPWHLRKELGLPVQSALDKMYGYHFYRLIQRAQEVHIGYLNQTESQSYGVGEVSRFLRQLEWVYARPVVHHPVNLSLDLKQTGALSFAADSLVSDWLSRYTSDAAEPKSLSPSALNTYLDCSLKYYYTYILGLREPDEKEDLADPRVFGTLVHASMEQLYATMPSGQVSASRIRRMLEKNRLAEEVIVPELIRNPAFTLPVTDYASLGAKEKLVVRTVEKYLKRILETDAAYAPFSIVGLERTYYLDYPLTVGERSFQVRIGGIVDRLDLKGDVLRVLDYKTGKPKMKVPSWEKLTDRMNSERPREVFQAVLYAYVLKHNEVSQGRQVVPVLYALRHAEEGLLVPFITMENQVLDQDAAYDEKMEQLLDSVLSALYDPEAVFEATQQTQTCRYCRFSALCQREGG